MISKQSALYLMPIYKNSKKTYKLSLSSHNVLKHVKLDIDQNIITKQNRVLNIEQNSPNLTENN